MCDLLFSPRKITQISENCVKVVATEIPLLHCVSCTLLAFAQRPKQMTSKVSLVWMDDSKSDISLLLGNCFFYLNVNLLLST